MLCEQKDSYVVCLCVCVFIHVCIYLFTFVELYVIFPIIYSHTYNVLIRENIKTHSESKRERTHPHQARFTQQTGSHRDTSRYNGKRRRARRENKTRRLHFLLHFFFSFFYVKDCMALVRNSVVEIAL